MTQMGESIVYGEKPSRIIQMGTNALDLSKTFSPVVQRGEKDIATPQPTYANDQQQQPRRHNEEEHRRQQQMQQIQM